MKSSLALLLSAGCAAAQSLTEALASSEELSTLNSLLTSQPDLVSALSQAEDITVLAPSNSALDQFLADPQVQELVASDPAIVAAILSYHVVNGTFYASAFSETPVFVPTLLTNSSYTNVTGGQVVKGVVEEDTVMIYSAPGATASVTTPNVNFTGGTVHVIDSVLQIPMDIAATAAAANLTSLLSAVTSADLAGTLLGLADVTVFAPTNAAFAAVSNVTAGLSTEQLASVLTYHVVQGTVGYSVGLSDGMEIETVQGGSVEVEIEDGSVLVDDATVVVADVLVANGVVHVIDMVLIPESDSGASPTTSMPGAESTTMPTGGVPAATAAVGAAALLGGAAAFMNF